VPTVLVALWRGYDAAAPAGRARGSDASLLSPAGPMTRRAITRPPRRWRARGGRPAVVAVAAAVVQSDSRRRMLGPAAAAAAAMLVVSALS
jgi:hypothetical protein